MIAESLLEPVCLGGYGLVGNGHELVYRVDGLSQIY